MRESLTQLSRFMRLQIAMVSAVSPGRMSKPAVARSLSGRATRKPTEKAESEPVGPWMALRHRRGNTDASDLKTLIQRNYIADWGADERFKPAAL